MVLATTLAVALLPAHATVLAPSSAGVASWAEAQMGAPSPLEDREKVTFLLSLLLGPAGAFAGAAFQAGGRRAHIATLAVLVVSVPALSFFVKGRMQGGVMGTIVLGAIVLAGIAGVVFALHRLAGPAPTQDQPLLHVERAEPRWALPVALAVLGILIFPLDVAGTARSIGPEMHMASYIVGPALYAYSPGLIPGIDYFTQYSVGAPWLFHFMLGNTLQQTMEAAVWFIVFQIAVFEVTLFLFLRALLKNWIWALALAIIALLLQFTTPEPLYAPSSTASRYMLAPVAAWLAVIWVRKRMNLASSAGLAAAIAASLFLNTETGAYAAVAAAVVGMASSGKLIDGVRHVATLAGLSFVFFMALSLIAFGPGVLSVDYLRYWLEPLMIYGGGLASVPLQWPMGMGWLYNVASPGLALATIGWCIFRLRRPMDSLSPDLLAGLMFIALFGLLMTAKYVNQSHVALWLVNSWALWAVAAWWARKTLEAVFPDHAAADKRNELKLTVSSIGLVCVSAVFLAELDDTRNPSPLTFESYATYPSVLNTVVGVRKLPCTPGRVGCVAGPVSPRDVELIRSLVPEGQRAAVLDMLDWVYLNDAKRAPKFPFMPSIVMFTERQTAQALDAMNLVFLPRQPAATHGIGHGVLAEKLAPDFLLQFEKVAEGDNLIAWRKIPSAPPTIPQPESSPADASP